jgi:hypothetical protein
MNLTNTRINARAGIDIRLMKRKLRLVRCELSSALLKSEGMRSGNE